MNPNAKHTPGPWEFYPSKDQDGDSTLSIRGNAEFIATMDTQSINGGPFKLPPNGEANARLIAAAPALLDSLKSAVSYLEANRPKGKIREIFHQLNEYENGVLKPARAAIAQAEGGAQ